MKKIDIFFEGILIVRYSGYDRIVSIKEEKIYLVFNDKDELMGSIPFSYMILKIK